jgi:hypothetical protein
VRFDWSVMFFETKALIGPIIVRLQSFAMKVNIFPRPFRRLRSMNRQASIEALIHP